MNNTTSIKIDRALWKQAKIEAVKRDLQLQDFIELAVRKELKRSRGLPRSIERTG